jgi:hypothetical protein
MDAVIKMVTWRQGEKQEAFSHCTIESVLAWALEGIHIRQKVDLIIIF